MRNFITTTQQLATLSIILASSIVFITCSKKKDSNPEPEQKTKTMVHLAGTEYNNLVGAATYWKDGVSTVLNEAGNNAQANAIVASGSSIHIAGYEFINSKKVFVHWKDKVATKLTASTGTEGNITSMAVANNDVYIAGHEYVGGKYVASYWKNKESAVRLTGGTGDTYAYGLLVSEGKVYIVGSINSNGKTTAALWENGVLKELSDKTNHAQAMAVSMVEDKLYIAGTDNGVATLWEKSGSTLTATTFPNGPSTRVVVLKGKDIYMVGHNGYAKNNGSITPLEKAADNSVYPSAMAIDENDVYVVGSEMDGTTHNSVARLWKNGKVQEIQLKNTKQSSYIEGIILTKENL